MIKYSERGVGHLGAIIAIVVVLIAGGIGWFVYNKNKGPALTPEQQAVQDALKNATCNYEDKDLCKFFTSYKAQKFATIRATTKADDKTTTMTIKSEGDTKSHVTIDGDTSYEVITIDKTTYTKAPNGTWWKQANPTDAAPTDLSSQSQVAFDEPTTEAQVAAFQKQGKEACGELTCFKYKQTEDGNTTTLWFDDQDYQLRRTVTEGQGSSFDATYSYEPVSIGVPSPVKDLAPGQYLLPGQNEPTTLPSAGDAELTPEQLQQLIDQYQNN